LHPFPNAGIFNLTRQSFDGPLFLAGQRAGRWEPILLRRFSSGFRRGQRPHLDPQFPDQGPADSPIDPPAQVLLDKL
jgi:hypothetical protein